MTTVEKKGYTPLKKNNIDLSQDSFAQIGGIRGWQFGKEVYSSMLKFKDLQKFLEAFPNVQRGMSKANVKSIKKYILSGIGEKSEAYMRFFNSITVTCRGTIIYDDDKRTILIDTRNPLSINDGQHRTEGIKEAILELQLMIKKTKDLSDRQEIENQLDILENMTVPVIIFNDLTESQEKQLFFDLNNLQRRPSKSANIRLSQTDYVAKMAKDISEINRYFTHYGVEVDKQSLYDSNSNTFLLTTIYNAIKELLTPSLAFDKNYIKEKNFERVKQEVNKELERILYCLPNDMDIKGKYLIEKNYTLIAICKFITTAKENKIFANSDDMYDIIKTTDWTYTNRVWVDYGGIKGLSKKPNIIFGASSMGKNAIYKYLIDKAKKVLADKEKSYIKNN